MLATQIEVSDGTLNIINVGIEFFEQDDISVSLDQADPLVEGVDYQWTAPTTLQFLNTLNTPGGLVPNGIEVIVRRDTKSDEMYNVYDGGAPFSRLTLDENFEQLLFLSQEFAEGLGLDGLRNNLNMNGYRVINLGDPIDPADATNKEYVDTQDGKNLRTPEAIPALPAAAGRANKILAFDVSGDPILVVPVSGSAEDLALLLADGVTPGNGAGMIGYNGTTVQDALDDTITLLSERMHVVDTIADLKLLPASIGRGVFVLGYYAKGDGGGGAYYKDAADVVSADNGGTVIVATDTTRWKLKYTGSVSIDQFGAKSDGTDASLRIQAAFDFSSTTKVPLTASAKTYSLALSQNIAVEGFANAWTALVVKTGLKLTGAGIGKTIFRLMNGQSSSLAPKWFNVMTGNTVITNLHLSNYTVDINGQNNGIDSPGDPLPGYTCAALMITGSVASVGVDARLIDSVIEDLEVLNNPGVTNIGIGSRYANPGITSRNVVIQRIRNYNSGIDSKDHSSIFAFGDNVRVLDCEFDHPVAATTIRCPIVAVELHGNGNEMAGCNIRNYMQVAWISAGDEGERTRIHVHDNRAEVSWFGIALFTNAVWNDNMSGIDVHNNLIRITGEAITHPQLSGAKFGIYMAVGDGCNVLRMNIHHNQLYSTDRINNVGIFVGANAGAGIGEVSIDNNITDGFSKGILVAASGGYLVSVVVDNNKTWNCAATPATPIGDTRGVQFTGTSIFSLRFSNNSAGSGTFGTAPNIGLELNGPCTDLYADGNDGGDSVVGFQDTATVSGFRDGAQALTRPSRPLTGQWRAGQRVRNANPTQVVVGGGLSYVVNEWLRVTNGSGSVLNTDWYELRNATGN